MRLAGVGKLYFGVLENKLMKQKLKVNFYGKNVWETGVSGNRLKNI